MARNDYMPKDDEGKAALFERFRQTLPTYAATLGITAEEMAAQAADATWFRHILNRSISMRDCARQFTRYKDTLLTGNRSAAAPLVPIPAAAEPDPVPPGILARFRKLVRRIKAAARYTQAIGEALGIVGPDAAAADSATLAPKISLRVSGGQVEIIWNKARQEAVEIQKDSGNGWEFLAMDTHPNHIDRTPFPTPAAKWKYRATYTKDSQHFGSWSTTAEITVGG